jgi:RNA polymerase-binding transcription factor DksA
MKTDPLETQRHARSWLKSRSVELRERIARVEGDLRREAVPLPADAPDAAVVRENEEVLQAIGTAGRAELTHIAAALDRLEEGFYGICESCGVEIDAGRLRAVPYAVRCAHCAS